MGPVIPLLRGLLNPGEQPFSGATPAGHSKSPRADTDSRSPSKDLRPSEPRLDERGDVSVARVPVSFMAVGSAGRRENRASAIPALSERLERGRARLAWCSESHQSASMPRADPSGNPMSPSMRLMGGGGPNSESKLRRRRRAAPRDRRLQEIEIRHACSALPDNG